MVGDSVRLAPCRHRLRDTARSHYRTHRSSRTTTPTDSYSTYCSSSRPPTGVFAPRADCKPSYTTAIDAPRRTLPIRHNVHPDASPPADVTRSTQRRRDRLGFRLGGSESSVPILTAVQDVAFDERMMLREHNRSSAAATATRVHAVANSETARVTRRTTAGRLPGPATRRAHHPSASRGNDRRDHGAAILCPRTPTVCPVDRFDEDSTANGPPPRLNRFSTTC